MKLAAALISGLISLAAAAPPFNVLSSVHVISKRALYTCDSGAIAICYDHTDSSDFPGCEMKCASTITLVNCQNKFQAQLDSDAAGTGTAAPRPSVIGVMGMVNVIGPTNGTLSECQLQMCPTLGAYTACLGCMLQQWFKADRADFNSDANAELRQLVATINDTVMPAWDTQCKQKGQQVGAWEKIAVPPSSGAVSFQTAGLALAAAVSIVASILI